jgi:putrescine transport system ATP-binding protein
MVKRPRVLLLDEPMAALDKKLRGETQFELMDLQRRLGLTFVIVTHDQSEAMTVADRIAVMDRGRLMQVAPPAEIYEQPNSRWVADFIGSINLFEGRVGDAAGTIEGTALGRLRVTGKIDAEPNATVWVAVRPEKIRLIPCAVEPTQRANAENCVLATVVDIGYLGDLSLYKLRTEAGVPLQAAIANIGPLTARGISWNDQVWLSFAPEAAIVLTR